MVLKSSILILFFFFLNMYSQRSEGIATYKVFLTNLNGETESNAKQTYNKLIDKNRESIEEFSFTLFFNQNTTLYKMDKGLFPDNNKGLSKMSIVLVRGNDIYYSDKKNNLQVIQKDFVGDKINVETKIDKNKWELTKEKKKILDFECHKAISYKEKENANGVYLEQVIAWYAPEIPISAGPRCFQDLPGLILELQEGSTVFYCVKINFENVNPSNFLKPKSKIIMNAEEYSKHVKQKGRELFRD